MMTPLGCSECGHTACVCLSEGQGVEHSPVYAGQSLVQRGCGAIECMYRCDGDHTHDTCPNAIRSRRRGG